MLNLKSDSNCPEDAISVNHRYGGTIFVIKILVPVKKKKNTKKNQK